MPFSDILAEMFGYPDSTARAKFALEKATAQKGLQDTLRPPTVGTMLNAPTETVAPDTAKIGADQALTQAFQQYQARKNNMPNAAQTADNTALGIPTAPAPTLPPQLPTVNPRAQFAKQVGLRSENILGMEEKDIPNYEKLQQADYYGGRNETALAKTNNPNSIANISWATATPQQKSLAEQMAKGNVKPTDIGFRERGPMVSLANEYAQMNSLPFRSYEGSVKQGMAQNLAYGKMGQNALSYNTAISHANDLLDAFEKVGNTDINLLNKPINALKQATNDPNIVALEVNLAAFRSELASAFKTSGATDQEIAQFAGPINENLTIQQAYGAVTKAADLLQHRIDQAETQQHNVMDESSANRQLLNPKNREIMKKFKNINGDSNTEYGSAGQVKAALAAGKITRDQATQILQEKFGYTQ